MYEDFRDSIAAVDRLGALRHVDGGDPLHEIGGIAEGAACSNARRFCSTTSWTSRRLSHLHQCDHESAASRAWRSTSIRIFGHSTHSRRGSASPFRRRAVSVNLQIHGMPCRASRARTQESPIEKAFC
jgi:hypothetical protein